MRARVRIALGLLLLLHLPATSQGGTAAAGHEHQVAFEPSLASWAEASQRCAALGPGLAPHELAAQAAADGLLGAVATHLCTHESDAIFFWISNGNGSSHTDPGALCKGLLVHYSSRQARVAMAACGQRHCFLCSTQQAGLRASSTGSARTGRSLLQVADSSNCNMTGQ
jgi:hypothetical protein